MILFDFLIQIYIGIVVIRVIMSWVQADPYNKFVQFVVKATEPVLSKIRQVIPPFGGLDLAPMILIFGLYILRRILG